MAKTTAPQDGRHRRHAHLSAGLRLRLVTAVAVMALALTACSESEPWPWQGYVEGDTLYIGAPLPGMLTQLDVERGDQVQAGQPLFALDRAPEDAALREADARVKTAEATLADLQKGQRPAELEVLQAQYRQAQAALTLSRNQWRRVDTLAAEGAASQAERDDAQTRLQRDQQQVRALRAQLDIARLGEREDRIAAAQAQLTAARAQREQIQWRLTEKTQTAPDTGQVQDILFRPGEFVPAGQPVVALLSPHRFRIRFFVPETALAQLRTGDEVTVRCDGCATPFQATIRFISGEAAYTPPFIYSRNTRDKFVYRVDAEPRTDRSTTLHPGQPVDVHAPDTVPP
ncbi:HlyD family secretion protein [Marinobacter caseinilyticus]|uniref:HlyD family secretion protein n=1 Tax=Marinobacter caseinilyticus TaxID=2692195 RepID=UPI001A93D61D|nr:HlyD family efflux transporter periplasmic adaptor subunit [Marinobacter caseinilyticus]